MTRRFVVPSLALGLALGLAAPALAQTAPVQLLEVSTGTSADPTAQYVVLGVHGTVDLTGVKLTVQDQGGGSLADFRDFPTTVAPNAGGFIVVGASGFASAYGLTPTVAADNASLPVGAGRLCLVDGGTEIDCVAWGQFTGNNRGWGSPVVNGGQLDHAMVRIQFTGNNMTDWTVTASPDPATYYGAGSDGGVADGGGADAGVLDAGTVDGGAPDGGIADGGTPDGGIADGGTPDGGARDAGSVGSAGTGSATGGSNVPTQATGCGCSTTGGGFAPGILLLVLGLVALRRRRPVDPRGGRR